MKKLILILAVFFLLAGAAFADDIQLTTDTFVDWDAGSAELDVDWDYYRFKNLDFSYPHSEFSGADIIKALELALGYAEDISIETVQAVYTPPAEALRQAADRIEQKERDIAFIKDVLKKLKD